MPSAIYRRPADGRPFERVDTVDVSSNMWRSSAKTPAAALFTSDFNRGFRSPGREAPVSALRGWGATLLHDRRGNFWVGTQGPGPLSGSPASAPAREEARGGWPPWARWLISNAVQSLYEDRDGNLWLGTTGRPAAAWRRTASRRFATCRFRRAGAAASDGSVWVGTTAGLSRFSLGRPARLTRRPTASRLLVFALQGRRGARRVAATAHWRRATYGARFSADLAVPQLRSSASQRIIRRRGWLLATTTFEHVRVALER